MEAIRHRAPLFIPLAKMPPKPATPPEPKTLYGRATCRNCDRPILSITFVFPDRSLYIAYCQGCKHLELVPLTELPPHPPS